MHGVLKLEEVPGALGHPLLSPLLFPTKSVWCRPHQPHGCLRLQAPNPTAQCPASNVASDVASWSQDLRRARLGQLVPTVSVPWSVVREGPFLPVT